MQVCRRTLPLRLRQNTRTADRAHRQRSDSRMIPISRQVFWGPMALAIIGGLLVATLVTLTVLPAAMSLVMRAAAVGTN